jgi:hypothetical protein
MLVIAGVSPMALATAATQLRRRGAHEAHGCGVAVDGAATASGLDSYTRLQLRPNGSTPFALAGDAA